jgi:hypothetical protein
MVERARVLVSTSGRCSRAKIRARGGSRSKALADGAPRTSRRIPSPEPGTTRRRSSPSSTTRSYSRNPKKTKLPSVIHFRSSAASEHSSASSAGGGSRSSAISSAAPAHRGVVLGRRAHLVEDGDERVAQPFELRRLALAVDLDVNERLRRRALVGRGVGRQHRHELARGIALHAHDGMDQQVDAGGQAVERDARRIDEERHIVADELDDRVRGLPSVLLECGRGSGPPTWSRRSTPGSAPSSSSANSG